jgi:hypothetical protein
VVYAGDPVLGRLLREHFELRPEQVVAVPNGFNREDLEGVPLRHAEVQRDGSPLDLVFGGYWYGRNGPGILVDALSRVGRSIASVSVIGYMSPSIERQFKQALGYVPEQHESLPRKDLYQRLSQTDAAVITLDYASAVESRIPAKCYDCLAVGVPVIAICPPDAALLRVETAGRFHHIDHRDSEGLAALLRRAATSRAVLRHGSPGSGPNRDEGVAALAELLERITSAHPSGMR